MLSTINQFSDIVLDHEIIFQEFRSDLSKIKVNLTLIDESVIYLREVILQEILHDYSYHWVSKEGKLIIRWDNAAHYPEIKTFPHHKHVGDEKNVKASQEQNLKEVLTFITQYLSEVNTE